MGGDGGSIPHRTEMVKTKRKAEQLERDIQMVALWRMCALTSQPLKLPIVTCPLGRLYNKEAVIEALLDKKIAESENAGHIKSIRDLKELRLTANPSFEAGAASVGDRWRDLNLAEFVCPVSGLEMNGKARFAVVWACGCVLSEKCLREVASNGVCHKCGGPFDPEDVVVLNGTEKEMDLYFVRLEATRAAAKAAKAANKGKVPGGKRKAKASAAVGEKKAKEVEIQDDPKRSAVFKNLFTTSEDAKKHPVHKANWVTFNPLYN